MELLPGRHTLGKEKQFSSFSPAKGVKSKLKEKEAQQDPSVHLGSLFAPRTVCAPSGGCILSVPRCNHEPWGCSMHCGSPRHLKPIHAREVPYNPWPFHALGSPGPPQPVPAPGAASHTPGSVCALEGSVHPLAALCFVGSRHPRVALCTPGSVHAPGSPCIPWPLCALGGPSTPKPVHAPGAAP